MQRNFERSNVLVLKSEGGFVNNVEDPGGPTNLGVTIGTATELNLDIDKDGDVDVTDIRLLQPADAGKVYKKHYWDKVAGDKLPDGLDYAVFDFAVNSGPTRAVKFLQAILGVTQDGKVGPQTLDALIGRDILTLINQYQDNRLAFLVRLPTFAVFGKGWTARVKSVRTVSLSWSGAAATGVPAQPQVPSKPPVAPTTVEAPATSTPSLIAALIDLILTLLKGFRK